MWRSRCRVIKAVFGRWTWQRSAAMALQVNAKAILKWKLPAAASLTTTFNGVGAISSWRRADFAHHRRLRGGIRSICYGQA